MARAQQWLDRAQAESESLAVELEDAERAAGAQQYAMAVSAVDRIVPRAIAFGLRDLAIAAEELRALALLRATGPGRARRIEAAVRAYRWALENCGQGDEAARLLDGLGNALAQRLNGDPGEVLEHAIEAQRAGLAELSAASPPSLIAIAQTNLAASLLSREHGDRIQNLEESY